jgi:CheY-like chemotaxis protein
MSGDSQPACDRASAEFAVWLAADGWKALQIYEQQQSKIALVLLDVRMPGWDGPRTLAALQRLDPAVRYPGRVAGPPRAVDSRLMVGTDFFGR